MNETKFRLNPQLESNVRHLKSLGYGAEEICQQLGIHHLDEIRAVSDLLEPRKFKQTFWKGAR